LPDAPPSLAVALRGLLGEPSHVSLAIKRIERI
jgi:hypothetical protein